jgi:hypothetical protein
LQIATSNTKTPNVEIIFFLATSALHTYSFVREIMWWWLPLARKKMWRWIAFFGDSYNSDASLFAKQLFSDRLLLMTKYCVMRECENIHSWISLSGDLVFSNQDGISIFNSLKEF